MQPIQILANPLDVPRILAHIIKPLVGQSPTTSETPNILSNNSRAKGWSQGRSSPPLMSRLSSPLYQYFLPYKLSNKGFNRTPHFHKEPACQYHKSHPYWSSASTTLTSSSRVSIMNRSKVQPWGPPPAPS